MLTRKKRAAEGFEIKAGLTFDVGGIGAEFAADRGRDGGFFRIRARGARFQVHGAIKWAAGGGCL